MKRLNAFQVIAVFGIIFSAASQGLLWLLDKQVANFYFLYPTWVLVFIAGMIINPFLPKDDHHHH